MENYQVFISFFIPNTFKPVRPFDFILSMIIVRAIIKAPIVQIPKLIEKAPKRTIIIEANIEK